MIKPTKKVTIKDISRIAGVSTAAVSIVLNGKPGVSEATRYRILRVARELNYTPNLLARSLVSRRSPKSIALMITNIRNAIFPEIAAGIEEVLREHDYSLSIVSTFDDEQLEAKQIDNIKARGVDGVIVSSPLIDNPNIPRLVAEGFPVVSVLRYVYGCDDLDFVIVDNFKGGYLAVEHLARIGHKKIAIVGGPVNTSTGLERFRGGVQALKDYGIPTGSEYFYGGDFFRERGYLAAHYFLNLPKHKRPSAIYACNDDMAIGVIEALMDSGLKVPDDMAVVGFNNVEATSMRAIDLSTIDQHAHAIGRMAAQRLIAKLEGTVDGKGFRKVLEPRLVIRGSCGYSRTGYEWPLSQKSLSLKGKEIRDVSRKNN
jgi:LacI family transcriptional regulator